MKIRLLISLPADFNYNLTKSSKFLVRFVYCNWLNYLIPLSHSLKAILFCFILGTISLLLSLQGVMDLYGSSRSLQWN